MKTNLLRILFILVLSFVFVGCTRREEAKENAISDNNNPNSGSNSDFTVSKRQFEPDQMDAVEYGNGIYYFHLRGAAFGNVLSHFKKKHPNLEEVTITGEVARMRGDEEAPRNDKPAYTADYGATVGYWVTFREKK